MKKILVALATFNIVALAAPTFNSSQAALDEISAMYDAILQEPNIYDQKVSFNRLIHLGEKLNTYILSKQGILAARKSSRKGGKQGDCIVPNEVGLNWANLGISSEGELRRCTNLFDIWDLYLYPQSTELINKLMNDVKIRKNVQEKHNFYKHDAAFKVLLDQIKKIRVESIIPDKKKIADIMIFFIEQNRELVEKAMEDRKK